MEKKGTKKEVTTHWEDMTKQENSDKTKEGQDKVRKKRKDSGRTSQSKKVTRQWKDKTKQESGDKTMEGQDKARKK